MNSRQRFLAALRGEPVDRPPLAYVSALTNLDMQERTGCAMPEVHLDGEKLFRLCAAAHEHMGFDAVTFIINAFSEPAALGCPLRWGGPGELPAYLSAPWAEPGQAAVPEDLLDRPPIRACLESLRLARRHYGERLAVLGKVVGPLTLIQVMHGVERTMIGLIDDPARLQRLLALAVEIQVLCGNAQFDEGIDAIAIGEGGAGATMMSPQMYEELLLPFHQEMVARLKGPAVMHICGDITPRLASLRRVGFACFNFDWAIAPARMKQAAEGRFRLMGNVNTTDLLFGRPETIEAQVSDCLEAGIDIISPGCAVSPLCPTANLKALASGIDKWCAGRRGATSPRRTHPGER